MIYVLFSLEKFLIAKKVSEIINNDKIDMINVNSYDLENSNLDTILEDANTYSLFDNKKVILVNNSYIFTGAIKKNDIEQNIEMLSNYVVNPNPNCILIFTVISEKLDERKKIVKLLKEKCKVIELNSKDITSIVKSMFDGYKISISDINFLINRVGNNLNNLKNEVDKLKAYKFDEKEILKEDIIACVKENIDLDIFKFIDNIINKNKSDAIETYNELLIRGEEPIKIIIMLSNQFRIMYQAKELSKKGYSEKDIASTLNVHPYRIKMALINSRKYNSDDLLGYIKKLSDLDINIKSGKVSSNIALELFILEV